MGAPKIPDRTELQRWISNGLSNAEILERYQERGGVEHMTTQAISMFRSRNGLPSQKPRHAGLIPWALAPQHRSRWAAKMLRAEGRRRKGETLDPRLEGWLDNWLARFSEGGDLAGHVVTYHPDIEDGFVYVPRREGIDLDLIREPDAA